VTRPDARLLVPVASLPGGRAPVGATVWQEHPYRGLSAGVTTYCREDAEVYVVWADGRLTYEPASSLHLDLSRPDVVDGVPVRLDALGWALGVLGWDRLPENTFGATWDVWRGGARFSVFPPDLSGLSGDDASRAVVAAALRGGA
jgi:hypothetical protein